jgi:predicted metalloprotease
MFTSKISRSFKLAAAVAAIGGSLALTPSAFADQITPQTTPDAEIAAVNPSLLDFWQQAFHSWGLTYRPAAQVVYYDYQDQQGNTVWASCGGQQLNQGIYGQYCSSDNTVYIDYGQNTGEMGKLGSYEAGALYAHEIGHNVQTQLNLTYQQPYSELQADCLSGMYTRWAVNNGELTADDAQQGVDWAYTAGGGGDTGKDLSHGTQYDRGVAWYQGYAQVDTSGNPFDASVCNQVTHQPDDQQQTGDPNQLFPIPGAGQSNTTTTDESTGVDQTSSTDTSTSDSSSVIDQLLQMNTSTSVGLAQSLIESQAHDAAVWVAPACDSSYNGCL